MRRRELIIKLGALGLMGMAPALAGCIGAGTEGSSITATPTPAATAVTATATASSTTTAADALARTCSKGKSCTSPQCGQWSDLDGNGLCDRGYF